MGTPQSSDLSDFYWDLVLGNTAQRPRCALCRAYACIFSVIFAQNFLKYAVIPASDLYKLTKNLTAQSTHNHCAVLPKK